MAYIEQELYHSAFGTLSKGSVPISVTVITKNEEANIAECLQSVAFAAHIVVVDAQSTDATVKIAAEMGADVYVRTWPGYTEQRNFSIAQCNYDWVLSVDADERVTRKLAEEIARLMISPPPFHAYRVPELNNYFGRWLLHGGIYPGYHVSLFDRRQGLYEEGMANVHEDVHFETTGTLSGHILHFAYPNFSLALRKLDRYTDLEAEGRMQRGISAGFYGIFWRPVERFIKNYFFKFGFLDGIQGFLYCFLSALYSLSTGVKMWEIKRQSGNPGNVLHFPKRGARTKVERWKERKQK